MNDLLTAGGGIGAIMPVLVSVVVRSNWPGWVKGLVAVVASIVFGAISAATAGDLTGATLLQGFLIVMAASQLAYQLFWKTTGIGPDIERATQPDTAGRHAEANSLANPARARALRTKPPADQVASTPPIP